MVTNLEDKKVQIEVTAETIGDALKLRPGYFSLTDKITDQDKRETFLQLPGATNTYRDLVRKEVEIPLHIFVQHFTLTKPIRYTKPSLRMASLFTKSMTRMHLTTNFSKYFLSELQHMPTVKVSRRLPT